MHPALNYRQSRRSACDRCRGFKLRCERDHVNGRSCERCLKAQVPCTTSVGQPVPNYIPPKSGSGSLPADFDGQVLSSGRISMPVIHKPSMSKVRKPHGSSVLSRKHENERFNSWIPPDPFSYGIQEGICSVGDHAGFHVPAHHNSVSPFEQWNDQFASWAPSSYQLPPMEEGLFETQRPCTDHPPFTETLAMNMPLDVQNQPGTDLAVPPSAESTNFLDQMPTTIADDVWHQSWDCKPDTAAFNPASLTITMDSTGPYSLSRKILKLNLDLIDDLELLETGSMTIGSSCLLREDLHPTTGKLDLPVFRMLSHSTQFLEILESEIVADPFENSVSLASTSDPSQKSSSVQDDTKSPSADFMGGHMDDGETTTSTHDSGYFSLIDAASERTKCLPLPKCEISTALSILATYCHLVRVYRAIFTQLYQLFLIIPPADATAFLLLPSLQFGQFHMDGNLTVKVQVLIELSSSMLEKIERTLGLSQGSTQEVDGKASPALYILEGSPLVSIRDHIMAQEQVSGSIPLKETMNCLRQLLKDHVNV